MTQQNHADPLTEWLKTQSEDVRNEFDAMEAKQREIDNREMPVSQIYYGNKPVHAGRLDDFIRFGGGLTIIQKKVGDLLVHGMTQQQIAESLNIDQTTVSRHITAIRKKFLKAFNF